MLVEIEIILQSSQTGGELPSADLNTGLQNITTVDYSYKPLPPISDCTPDQNYILMAQQMLIYLMSALDEQIV